MNNRFGKRRVTSLLLVLAMLVVSVVSLLPMTASAGSAPIEDFAYQTLKGATMLDDSTDFRFLFTVNSLEYENVGVILSKSVETPTYDGANCFTKKMTTVYSSVTADGEPMAAPTGRFWVACKMTGVPYSYFDGSLYVRAFVKPEGEDPIYSDTQLVTVNRALVFNSKSPAGNTFYDGNNDFFFGKKVKDIRGSNHFYPTNENPGGNDLWFEYSFLWNDTLHNWDVASSLAEMKLACFRNPSVWDDHREFYYLYTRNNNDPFKTSGDCPLKGHIDFSTYLPGVGVNCVVDLTSENQYYNGRQVGKYPAGWGSGHNASPYLYDSEYMTTGGWHRIGFRYHQEATPDGNDVRYSGYTELYIDGVKVWKVKTNMEGYKDGGVWKDQDWSLRHKAEGCLLLWTATAEDGVITGYQENDNMRVEARIGQIISSTNAVYIGAGDVAWTCGNGFQMDVSPVAAGDRVARSITLADGVTVSGMFYYTED